MDDIKELNKLSKQKTRFTKEMVSEGEIPYINLLLKLVGENHVFTDIQFNNFFLQATHSNKPFLLSNNRLAIEICTYMFSNYELDYENTQKLIGYATHPHGYYILDILFLKNHKFTYDNYVKILSSYYSANGLKFTKYNDNIVFLICLTIKNNLKYTFLDENKKLFDNIVFNENNFNLILLTNSNISNQYALEKFNDLLDIIFKKCNNNDKAYIFKTLIAQNYAPFKNCYTFYKYIINKFGYNDDFAKHIENIYLLANNNMLIFDLALKGYKITENNLNSLLSKQDKIILLPNDKYAKLGLPFVFLKKYQNKEYAYVPIIDLYPIFELPVGIGLLNMAVKQGKALLTNKLLNENKIIPNKETLDNAAMHMHIGGDFITIVTKILNYRIIPDSDTVKNINCSSHIDYVIKNFELLIKYGLVLTFSDIEYLLSKKIVIKDLERFGIEYDEKIYFLCFYYDVNDVAYRNKYTIDKNVIQLHNLCKAYASRSSIEYYLKENNMKIDRYTLHYLILCNKNLAKIYIDTYKIVPSLVSAYKLVNLDLSHKRIMDEHNLTFSHMLETYDMQ